MTSSPFWQHVHRQRVIVITPTYDRKVRFDGRPRLEYLQRLGDILAKVDAPLLWIVVEDASELSADVALLFSDNGRFRKHGMTIVHLCNGPTKQYGNAQRSAGLHYVRNSGLEGVVTFADDDNLYLPGYFERVRLTKTISLHAVGLLGPHGVERPYVYWNKVVGWDCGWLSRRYPVDTAGFAFHTSLLYKLHHCDKSGWFGGTASVDPAALYPDLDFGGETEFLEALVHSSAEFECLGGCNEVMAWHDARMSADVTELQPSFAQNFSYRCWSLALGLYASFRCQGLTMPCFALALALRAKDVRGRGVVALMIYATLLLENRRGLLRSDCGDKQLTSLLPPDARYGKYFSAPWGLDWRLREVVSASTLPLLPILPLWLVPQPGSGVWKHLLDSYRIFGLGVVTGVLITSQRWLRC
eukprot:TRINITY_DN48729_c0_g1_i1.p1 TRINITY_DN48729_c0_g1~~TRINITY_DN48729_c0_g1_i1.p1  ORF type:complete len:414 (-),score=36.93 TRINITY_DN48729_c0_g1_i1:51-1292(-)